MESQRKRWNQEQGELRKLLQSGEDTAQAIDLFMRQHALLHSGAIDPSSNWSYEDEIVDDLDETMVRRIPENRVHSIAWCIWHIARIEDVTMNMLVAGRSQLMDEEGWLDRLGISAIDTGNLMEEATVVELSAKIDIASLRAYRLAVGMRTREIVAELQGSELARKVDPLRLQEVLEKGAVIEDARDLIDYWGKRTIAGLLLMPPTRHNFVHLNEAAALKKRRN